MPSYLLLIVLPLRLLDSPPQMAGQVHCATLVGLLEELAAVQSGLRDEGVVVFSAELLAATRKSATDNTDGLELASRIADCFFVRRE